MPRSERAAYFDAINRTIAALHAVDPAGVGRTDYGRPGKYFARQVARWTRRYETDEATGRDPDIDALVASLPTPTPAGDETAIVHGDFRCDNLIVHPERAEGGGGADLELSTFGPRPLTSAIARSCTGYC